MILLLFLFVLTIFLLFVLLSPQGEAKEKKRVLTPEANLPPISQHSSPKRKDDTEALSQKLANLKNEYKKLEDELARERDAQPKLKDEIERLNASLEKDRADEEKLKTENKELREKLVAKDREYEKELSLNLGLRGELAEYKQKSLTLEQQRKQDEERLKIWEAQNKAYKEEVKRLGQELAQLNKKNQESQWVSRKEYEDLRARLKEKEDVQNQENSPSA